MKEKTLKLLFYLKRGAKSKAGKSPIMARLSVGRTMVQFSCKTACSPSLWDSRKHRLVGKSAEAVAVNAELDSLQVSVCRAYEDLRKKEGEAVTAEEVKALLFGLQSDSQGLLYHLEEYLARFRERVGVDRSERRYKFLRVFRGHLAAFLRHRYRVSDFPVHKADKAFIEDLEAYFAQEKAFKLNTTAGYLTVLASLLKGVSLTPILSWVTPSDGTSAHRATSPRTSCGASSTWTIRSWGVTSLYPETCFSFPASRAFLTRTFTT